MRIMLLLAALALAMPQCSFAAGFVGPGALAPVHLASEVLGAVDDAPCVLEGHIVARVRHRKNRYLFRDKSGEVIVEIRKKAFGSQTVTPQNLVRLEGEVNSDRKYANEVNVEIVTILN